MKIIQIMSCGDRIYGLGDDGVTYYRSAFEKKSTGCFCWFEFIK